MFFRPVIWVLATFMTLCGSLDAETDDVETFKRLMHQIFLQELGEDLRRKLKSISNEGVTLGRTNAEIDAMVRSRLTDEEKSRMRKAFEAIAGPAKKFARQKAKSRPVRLTRSSQFKKLKETASQENDDVTDGRRDVKNRRNKFDL